MTLKTKLFYPLYKLFGPVTIGDNAKIGAACIVVKDVPTNATCVMESPRLIIK